MNDSFIIANLVDFDQLYGHRNDAVGFAKCLEEFDLSLPKIIETLNEGDWLILTPSTDHLREYVPILFFSKNKKGIDLGTRNSFADLGKTIGEMFGLNSEVKELDGVSFYKFLNSKSNKIGFLWF